MILYYICINFCTISASYLIYPLLKIFTFFKKDLYTILNMTIKKYI